MSVNLKLNANDIRFEILGNKIKHIDYKLFYSFGTYINAGNNFELHTGISLEGKDIIRIIDQLNKFLNNEYREKEEMWFTEPDLEIYLFPQDTIKNSDLSSVVFDTDIMVFKIQYIIDGAYSGNYIPLFFEKEETNKFLQYFKYLIGKIDIQEPIIQEMIKTGELYGEI